MQCKRRRNAPLTAAQGVLRREVLGLVTRASPRPGRRSAPARRVMYSTVRLAVTRARLYAQGRAGRRSPTCCSVISGSWSGCDGDVTSGDRSDQLCGLGATLGSGTGTLWGQATRRASPMIHDAIPCSRRCSSYEIDFVAWSYCWLPAGWLADRDRLGRAGFHLAAPRPGGSGTASACRRLHHSGRHRSCEDRCGRRREVRVSLVGRRHPDLRGRRLQRRQGLSVLDRRLLRRDPQPGALRPIPRRLR